MRLMIPTALLAAAGLAWLMTAPPALAQSGVSNRPAAGTSAARPRTRVIVRQRSYLDPGPQVQPYSQHYTDYVFLNRRPLDTLGPGQSLDRQPLTSPWELGGNWRLR